jgi:hypothetical protein
VPQGDQSKVNRSEDSVERPVKARLNEVQLHGSSEDK